MRYLILLMLIGCVDNTYPPKITMVNGCIDRKLDLVDEPFTGPALVELRKLCEELYEEKKADFYKRIRRMNENK